MNATLRFLIAQRRRSVARTEPSQDRERLHCQLKLSSTRQPLGSIWLAHISDSLATSLPHFHASLQTRLPCLQCDYSPHAKNETGLMMSSSASRRLTCGAVFSREHSITTRQDDDREKRQKSVHRDAEYIDAFISPDDL